MSDQLPSRDEVAEALTFAPLTDAGADPIYDIARAYIHGGRLVDREAIDYEAAIEAWWAEYATGGKYNPATRAAIAAAIRDSR